MKKLPVICPSCDTVMQVSALSCPQCDTRVQGSYSLPVFLQLPQEEQDFILNFVLSGGSLKAMAKQLKKSYPTVRNRLDDIIEHLKTLQNKTR